MRKVFCMIMHNINLMYKRYINFDNRGNVIINNIL